MSFLSKMERKYGKYAIPDITKYLILCYAVGYILQFANSSVLSYLVLNPEAILHGQIWRLVSWILIPPESFDLFTLLMLYFYFSIGSTLERTWGTFRYNVYLISGMLFTILGAFLFYGVTRIMGVTDTYVVEMLHMTGSQYMNLVCMSFSTYYICMSLILAFAATFPNVQVLLMFVIPIKIKVLGIIDALILAYEFVTNLMNCVRVSENVVRILSMGKCFAISFSLINFVIFFVTTRKSFRSPQQIKRQTAYRRKVKEGVKISKHKCAICGRTQEDFPDLEFRFCSKCEGNYEYCKDHLFTHTHISRS